MWSGHSLFRAFAAYCHIINMTRTLQVHGETKTRPVQNVTNHHNYQALINEFVGTCIHKLVEQNLNK